MKKRTHQILKCRLLLEKINENCGYKRGFGCYLDPVPDSTLFCVRLFDHDMSITTVYPPCRLSELLIIIGCVYEVTK